MLLYEKPWRRQPTRHVRVKDEYAKHLVGMLLPSIGNRQATAVGSGNYSSAGAGGIAHHHTSASSYLRQSFTNYSTTFQRSRHVLITQFELTATPAADRTPIGAFGSTSGSVGNTLYCCGCTTAGDINVLVGTANENGSWVSTGINALDRKPHTVVIETSAATDYQFRRRVFVDGVYSANLSTFTTAAQWPYNSVCSLGTQRTSDVAGELNAKTYLVVGLYSFDGPGGVAEPDAGWLLTEEQGLSLSGNPWQLFEPRRILVPQAAASGLPTLGTVSATTITSSGFRPSVTYTY